MPFLLASPENRSAGRTPSSKTPCSGLRLFGASTGSFAGFAWAALPVRSKRRGSFVTEPESGIASPAAFSGFSAYGKAVPSWIVETVSGSSRWRKDSQTWVPFSTPYFCCAESSESAWSTSPPPPLPKRPPTTEASAIMSVTLKGSMSPALVMGSILPVRSYSPGK
ncbi:hypothetical protein GA0115252_10935 [Streptomyces sp. DfronAA-171]|nr:hypothetical protein GA0115252_10935 [Streptomyces sp. DfronAA-171]